MKFFRLLFTSMIFFSFGAYGSEPNPKEFMSAVQNCLSKGSSSLKVKPEEYEDEPRLSANVTVTISCEGEVAQRLYDFLDQNKSFFYLNTDPARNFIAFGKRQLELESFTEDGVASALTLGSGCKNDSDTYSCKLISKMSLYHSLAPFLRGVENK